METPQPRKKWVPYLVRILIYIAVGFLSAWLYRQWKR